MGKANKEGSHACPKAWEFLRKGVLDPPTLKIEQNSKIALF